MDALKWAPEALTAATSGSLSLSGGTAAMVVVRAVADALTVIICADRAALTSLPPDVTAEASPSTSFFRVVVAVHTPPAHAVCSAVGADPVVEADGTDFEDAADGVVAVVVVDPAHPVRRAAAAVRAIDFLMAFSRFAQVLGARPSIARRRSGTSITPRLADVGEPSPSYPGERARPAACFGSLETVHPGEIKAEGCPKASDRSTVRSPARILASTTA
jgi:hypothetical protein